MSLVLYATALSPPCRAVWFTAKTIGVDLQHKEVDCRKQEHLNPEFVKINPQHTVPLLEDNNKFYPDSHAICAYLVNSYAENDALYPKDPCKRIMVDRYLHFDSGTAFPMVRQILLPVLFENVKEISKKNIEAMEEVYAFLNTFLDGNEWITGDTLTIADFSLLTTINTTNLMVPIDEKYTNVHRWLKNGMKLPHYNEVNHCGLKEFKELFELHLNM